MAVVSMKQLLEAGVHFGHQTRRWNPKMAKYIFTERNGIYIIDLQKTVKKLEEAYSFVRQLSESGQSLLFVGTKKQAQEAIKDEALRCNMYYVNARWLGGMMTNFKTMRTRIDRLNQLKTMQADGTFDMLPKKEVIKHLGEIEKLEKYLGGVKEMKKLPGALFIVDTRKERNAIERSYLKALDKYITEEDIYKVSKKMRCSDIHVRRVLNGSCRDNDVMRVLQARALANKNQWEDAYSPAKMDEVLSQLL